MAEVTCQPDKQHRSVKGLTRTQEDDVVRYVAPSAMSRLRLLMGMVYANRPWRLVVGLSKVMMAAFAAGAVSLAYPTIWQLSATMGPWRLTAATVLASAALIAWLILDHKLWERPHSADERERGAVQRGDCRHPDNRRRHLPHRVVHPAAGDSLVDTSAGWSLTTSGAPSASQRC